MLVRCMCALLAVFAACVLIVQDVAAHGVTLDLYHPLPAESAFHRAFLVPWARKVAQDSGNRINIHLHAASAGPVATKGLYEQAEDGDADLVWVPIRTSVERFPRLGIVDAPFMAHTAQGASRAVSEYVRINDLLDRDLAGVRVLAVHVADGTQLHWSGAAVTPSAEVTGRRIAVASSVDAALLAALGAMPVQVPTASVTSTVNEGAAEGALLAWSEAGGVAGTHVEAGPGSAGMTSALFVLAMSPASYRTLADDLKAVIEANSGKETAAWIGRVLDEAAAESRKAAAARGDAVRAMTSAERDKWMQAASKLSEARAAALAQAGIGVRPLIDSAREQLRTFDSPK
jgi:TRAP-type C4-dicarboxylate transport system substrate-binding protein